MARNQPLPFRPGDGVRITEGTFAGMRSTVISPEEAIERRKGFPEVSKPPEPVWVLIEVFGRPVPVSPEAHQVEHDRP
jgi:transcription antitermination factor NusG